MSNKHLNTVGLLLGSFDPPHIGHIDAALQAFNFVDEVWFVPAWQNPWKEKSSDYWDRYLMINTLVKNYNLDDSYRFSVRSTEYTIKPKYTYELIEYLVKQYSNTQFFIIGGQDIIQDIKNWENGDYILEKCKMLPVDRTRIKISSSDIRDLIKNHTNPVPYITPAVLELIKNKNLYNYEINS